MANRPRENLPPNQKRCPSCGKVKDRDKFHRNVTRNDGLCHECKRCKNMVEAARYHARKADAKHYAKQEDASL